MTISHEENLARVFVLCGIFFASAIPVSLAQGQPVSPDEPAEAPEADTESAPSAASSDAQPNELARPEGDAAPVEGNADSEGDEERLRAIEQKLLEIDRLEKELESLKAAAYSSNEAEDYAALAADQEFEPSFNLSGFFDLNLYYYEFDESRESPYGVVRDNLSFVVNRLNLYFASQMSETTSALAEIRFTALPLGYERSYDDNQILNTSFERVDTRVLDPFTGEATRLGSIVIERVHLTWKPIDAFGVMAGRFLTPYGIWNVDHGSPVRLPILPPIFMLRQFIPSAQTGVQLFGRLFPLSNVFLDYAATASNNRGPAESVYDLNNNKALGLRLRGSYQGTDLEVALGGHLYYGTVRDVTKRISTYLPIFLIEVDEVEKYTELTGSLDFLFKLYDAKLQVEFIHGSVEYANRPQRLLPILEVETPMLQYQPDFERSSVYTILSYDFYFNLASSEMILTPYALFEHIVTDSTWPDLNQQQMAAGLAFRPTNSVVLKAEVNQSDFPDSQMVTHETWSYAAQMAVSF